MIRCTPGKVDGILGCALAYALDLILCRSLN
jgi:hypothetical protein